MQKLVVDNFKQISHAEIEVKDFLLLIGPQASGKSTIAKLIYFFKFLQQFYIDLFSVDSPEMSAETLMMNFNLRIITKFQDYFSFNEIPDPNFRIDYLLSSETEKSMHFSVEDTKIMVGFSKPLHEVLMTSSQKLLELRKQSKELIEQDSANEMKIRNDFSTMVWKESCVAFEDTKHGLYIPAGRNITVAFSEQFQMLFFGQLSDKQQHIGGNEEEIIRQFMLHSKRLVDFFSNGFRKDLDNPFGHLVLNIAKQIIKGSYKNEHGKESIQVDDKNSVFLGNASSGQQESIRIIQDLIFILCTQIDSIRFIEEPEAHIYPEAQKLLIELIVLVANHCHTQVIVTTHSPYVLSTFNNMLYYSKVLKSHPDKREEMERHFLSETLNTANEEFLGINADRFEAYSLNTDRVEYCQPIKDNKTKLIGDNFFDAETDRLNEDFAFLYNLI
jgi:ABC-type lipoprotein export system ATPase subunit